MGLEDELNALLQGASLAQEGAKDATKEAKKIRRRWGAAFCRSLHPAFAHSNPHTMPGELTRPLAFARCILPRQVQGSE